jgi:hypothetical protein
MSGERPVQPRFKPSNSRIHVYSATDIPTCSVRKKYIILKLKSRPRWPRGLRRRSAAARSLGMRVRIPPEARMPSVVSVVCCQVEVSVTVWSLIQRNTTECDLGTSVMMPRHTRAVEPWRKEKELERELLRSGQQQSIRSAYFVIDSVLEFLDTPSYPFF